MVHVRGLMGGPLQTMCYLVFDAPGGKALAVDAPLGITRRLLNEIKVARVELCYIVNTHGHWDHTADNVALQEATGALICAHTWDATRLANPTLATEDEPGVPVKPSRADRNLQDGGVLEVGDCRIEVLHTPGHTPGSVCLYAPQAHALFTGDTLFRGGVGRTNFPGGNAANLAKSLRRLATFPDETWVYPGHGLITRIGDERWLLELAEE